LKKSLKVAFLDINILIPRGMKVGTGKATMLVVLCAKRSVP
jgi:hypothetical protein